MTNTEADIKLSVICLTYNHEKFIGQALEGFVKQKTNFPFEVIVHDDASTDGTADIIRQYQQQYPHIIKPIFQSENQWKQGKTLSKTFVYPKIRGKYVAFNEGDDYWTDEHKLQKQVDFLEQNPYFSICFHPVKVIWEDGSQEDSVFPTKKIRFGKTVLTLQDLLKRNFIQTNSAVYRWRFSNQDYSDIPDNIIPGDYFINLLHAQRGNIKYMPDIMSVYRRHSGGVWHGVNHSDAWFSRYGLLHLRFYREEEERFQVSKIPEKLSMGGNMLRAMLRLRDFDKLRILASEFPDVWDESLKQALHPEEAERIAALKKRGRRFLKLNILLLILLITLAFYTTLSTIM